MSNNKFNASKRLGAVGASLLQYFPIKRFRFDTSHHPVIQSSQRCNSSVAALLSFQEVQMVEGLTNYLECEEREAIRIALYEASRSVSNASEMLIRCAESGSKEQGHTARSNKQRWNLAKDEKDSLLNASKQLKITDKEFVRFAIIRLSRGIHDGSITHLTDSKMRSQMELFRDWSKTHDGSPSKLCCLKKAAQSSWDDIDDMYEEEGKRMENLQGLRRLYRNAPYDEEIEIWIETLEESLSPTPFVFEEMFPEAVLSDSEWEILEKEIIDMWESMAHYDVEDRLLFKFNNDLTNLTGELLGLEYDKAKQELEEERRERTRQMNEEIIPLWERRKLECHKVNSEFVNRERISDYIVNALINDFFTPFAEKRFCY